MTRNRFTSRANELRERQIHEPGNIPEEYRVRLYLEEQKRQREAAARKQYRTDLYVDPSVLWGADAALVCEEFIDFIAQDKAYARGAGPNEFPIAFTDPHPAISHLNIRNVTSVMRGRVNTNNHPDASLSPSGTIGPIEMDSMGQIIVPKLGAWCLVASNVMAYRTVPGYSGPETEMYPVMERTFIETDVVQTLSYLLNEYVEKIAKG